MKYLMCHPDHFRVDYSINPWMQGGTVDGAKALVEWDLLREKLTDLGADIRVMQGQSNWPDMVFAANAGVVYKNKVVLSNFKHPERQGEKKYFREWFEQNGYEVLELPDDMVFEGRGDCFVFKDEYLLGGYGKRSEERAVERAAELLDLEPVTLELKQDKFYHLDTCLSIISDDLIIYYPPALELLAHAKLFVCSSGADLLPVSQSDADRFVCNSVTLGNTIVTPDSPANLSRQLVSNLAQRGYAFHPTPMNEFLKSGGGCRCLVLELE